MIQTANIKSTTYHANGFPFEMITVEKKGKTMDEVDFIMGDKNSEYEDEKPAHPVIFKQDFEIGQYPVTQALWQAIMGAANTQCRFKGANRPIENVNWNDIMIGDKENDLPAFLTKLNNIPAIKALNEADKKQFRLPTEAQWEYAARGGKYWADFNYRYAGSDQLKEVGWSRKNSNKETKDVGLKMSNILGLYDMSGNVWEWCEDIWNDSYKNSPNNGKAWLKGEKENIRVVRGGSWLGINFDCHVSVRNGSNSVNRFGNTGFRLSRY